MERGYIKIWRKTLESTVFADPNLFKVWAWCLLRANYTVNAVPVLVGDGCKIVEIEKGQFIFGRKAASKQLLMPPSSVYRRIKRLEAMGMLSVLPNNHYSLITVINWAIYNGDEIKSGQQADSRRTAGGQQADTEKKVLIKKKNKENTIVELKKNSTTKKNGYPYKKIIDFLNEKIGGDFKPTTETTKRHIKARFNEGFNLDDFENVIIHKVNEWSTDPEMNQYLRPQTLFGTKFESYLVDSRKTATPKGRISEWK